MHARTRQIRESALQTHIINVVRNAGWFAVKITSPSRRGIPDVLLIIDSKVHFCEVKMTTRSKPTAIQSLTHRQMLSAGASVAVVSGLKEADDYLRLILGREK